MAKNRSEKLLRNAPTFTPGEDDPANFEVVFADWLAEYADAIADTPALAGLIKEAEDKVRRSIAERSVQQAD